MKIETAWIPYSKNVEVKGSAWRTRGGKIAVNIKRWNTSSNVPLYDQTRYYQTVLGAYDFLESNWVYLITVDDLKAILASTDNSKEVVIKEPS